ncbi:MAG: PEGA domain-containing protein [Polyangiales bacterium]
MVPPRRVAGLAFALGVSVALPAGAQQQPPAQTAAPTGDAALVEARRLYDEGRAHFDAGRFVEALASFERAYLLRSNPVVLVPVLECQERLDRVVDAISTIERYLRERPNAPDRARMNQRLEVLRARPSRVIVTSTPPGARIVLDGRELAQSTPATLLMAPGRHRLLVTVGEQRGPEREVDALPGGSQELALSTTDGPATPPATPPPSTVATTTPDPTPPAPPVAATPEVAPTPPPEAPPPAAPEAPARRHTTSPAVWVAASAGGVGLVLGTVFGLMALSDASAYDQSPSLELYDRTRTNALVSDVGFGVAVLSAAVGVIVYFADRGSSSERPNRALLRAPAPRWSASPAGFRVNF